MLVKFVEGWFAPSASVKDEVRSISGVFYTKGVHNVPYELKNLLPSSCIILEKPIEEGGDEKIASLRDFDIERFAMDAEHKVRAEAQKNLANANATKRRNHVLRKAEELNRIE